jgi:hypothetical protein
MADVKRGPSDTGIDTPSHVKGIMSGNSIGNYLKNGGFLPDGTATARRSTGINPKDREPIDPRMPGLFPA